MGHLSLERDRLVALAVIVLAGITSLVVLNVSFWEIMRQDATALTASTAVIGGAIGYAVRALTERWRTGSRGD